MFCMWHMFVGMAIVGGGRSKGTRVSFPPSPDGGKSPLGGSSFPPNQRRGQSIEVGAESQPVSEIGIMFLPLPVPSTGTGINTWTQRFVSRTNIHLRDLYSVVQECESCQPPL